MKMTRRGALRGLGALLPATGLARMRGQARPSAAAMSTTRVATSAERGVATGPFAPTWDSLKQYKTPAWFRDAKFGIWAHWTAQCVPEQGDWYARLMYIQGSKANRYHVAHYGHPSKFGFKDIDHIWNAEKWEPEYLMNLYVKAGAKYFMSLANHHDNFDCFDSTYHTWNATRLGPKRDIVGTWAKLARKHGLRFGASNHSAHAWHWLQTSYGYDPVGPMKGVRYDGFAAASAGRGQWWNGYDPQELYVGPTFPLPEGITTEKEAADWHDAHDRIWSEDPPEKYPGFTNTWFLRTRELVDKYDLDFLYFDDDELPLKQTGLDVTAHFYNANLRRRGKLEAVVFGKNFKPEHMGAATLDLERGQAKDILAQPWQTDTCIGDWHYNIEVFEQHRYKSAQTVLQMLADIVSKNGNLCLNIPLKGNGTIDSDELKVLEQLATWFPANGEAIFGTRPYTVFGEGPQDVQATGGFNEDKRRKYTGEDIRFTTRDGLLYALVMARPEDGTVRLKTLGSGAAHTLAAAKVELLGGGALQVTRSSDALAVALPESARGDLPICLRLTPENGNALKGL